MADVESDAPSDNDTAHLRAQVADLLDVIYRVSHDLQAPLRRVGAFSELVARRADVDERATAWLKQVGIDAQLAQRRLGALLAYSRIGRDWVPAPVTVSELVTDAIRESMALRDRSVQTHLSVETLTLDAVSMKTALRAVLDNAARFAEQTIEVHAQADDAGGFSINVFNDGPPISERRRHRVLQLFNSTEPAERAGAGLAVAQRVMRMHGGGVQIADRDGQGCLVQLNGRRQG